MREHEVNRLDNFIMGWYGDDNEIDICDQLINHWHQDTDKRVGTTNGGKFNPKVKDSVDSALSMSNDITLFRNYSIKYLQRRVEKYIERYPYCNESSPWTIWENVFIQHYKPGGAFFKWHTERTSAAPVFSARHLVFMTYLNDVPEGGETEFLHQNLKIKPEKGLTLIWPADWTHTHRGVPSMTHEKYIATGWYNFYERT